MAFDARNWMPIVMGIGAAFPSVYSYQTDDSPFDVGAPGYFSGAPTEKARVSDIIYVRNFEGTVAYTLVISSVDPIVAGSAPVPSPGGMETFVNFPGDTVEDRINANIDYVSAQGGGCVYIPPSWMYGAGDAWELTGPIVLKTGVRLEGIGHPLVRKKAMTDAFTMVEVENGVLSNYGIIGIRFDGNRTNQAIPNQVCDVILINDSASTSEYGVVRDCEIFNYSHSGHGLHVKGTTVFWGHENLIYDGGGGGAALFHGMYFRRTVSLTVTGNIIEDIVGTGSDPGGHCIKVVDDDGVATSFIAIGNQMRNAYRGFSIADFPDLTITGNLAEGMANAAYFIGTEDFSRYSGGSIVGNQARDCATYGFRIIRVRGLSFTGNSAFECARASFSYRDPQRVTHSGNTAENNTAIHADGFAQLLIEDNGTPTGFNIGPNTYRSDVGSGNRYAIQILRAGWTVLNIDIPGQVVSGQSSYTKIIDSVIPYGYYNYTADADFTVIYGGAPEVIDLNDITANRTVTLSTQNVREGCRFIFVRKASGSAPSASDGFRWDISANSTVLVSLLPDQSCCIVYTGTGWTPLWVSDALPAKTLISKTAATTIIAAQSGAVFDNQGTTTRVDFTLPSARRGYVFTFINIDTDGMRISPVGNDTIRIAASLSTDGSGGGYIETTTVGNVVTLKCLSSTVWIATSVVGTWTVV